MDDWLPKSHRILEKGSMAFQPFGKNADGHNIRDVSGVTVRANVEFLEDLVTRTKGAQAGAHAVEELTHHLNERIPDSTYHVTQGFLRNPWNSYSYEFVIFLAEFCVILSEDEKFHIKLGREKLLSPLVQVLGRPFSIAKIYSMFPHFAEKFGKGALQPEVISSRNGLAILRLRLSEGTAQQFGAYRHGSAERICQSGKHALGQIPSQMFHLQPAKIMEPSCMADGADYCEWHISWTPQPSSFWLWPLAGIILSLVVFSWLSVSAGDLSLVTAAGLASIPTILLWLGGLAWTDRQAVKNQQQVIQEQLDSVESQHEALREAYANLQTLNQQLEAKVQERTFDLEQANRHLETTNEQLAELNDTKSRFLAHCSHELRTPLASIKGFSENLLSGLGGTLTDKQENSLQRIEINADRLARMIANLLDVSQIEAGKMHLHRSTCDLTALAKDVADHYHPLAQAKNQRIDVQGPKQGVALYADPDRITQILLNLLHNASKFTPNGGTILIVTELVSHQEASVSVIDSGPGIPADAIPKLFEPFFQAHRDREIGTKGLGLGLAIVQHLVGLHDGTIHVENHQPHGAIFRVQFPCEIQS